MSVFKATHRTLLTLIGGLSVFRAARSGSPDTFTLVPKLAQGQVLRYRQDLNSVRNGVIGHRSWSTVTLEILDPIPGGWLARWTSWGGDDRCARWICVTSRELCRQMAEPRRCVTHP